MAENRLNGQNKDAAAPDSKGKKKLPSLTPLMTAVSSRVKTVFVAHKRIVVIITVSVLSCIFVGVVLWTVFSPKDPAETEGADPVIQMETRQKFLVSSQEIVFDDVVDLDPFERIPLKRNTAMGMVSINLSLELMDHRYRKQVHTLTDSIRKIVIDQVAEMGWLELRNPEGKLLLKYRLLTQINALFPSPTVRNVYFTYFVMQ